MGAGVSAGENNDDLIDNLKEANYIKTSEVERVFRAVDRGAYLLPDPPPDAYRDVAWKNGNFHISAPCIYSEVMEGLKLKPGLSFLNLGSGTGYLNTVAGLILGSCGINHGIELHEEVIEYALVRLEEFKKHSGAIDEFDFCEPKFMQGNCLCLASGYHLYDRVYCGAACPEKYLNYMKNLIKVGGILVVPINEKLVEMRRVSEIDWTTHYLLPVSFTTLIRPSKESQEIIPPFDIEPLSLQELCRSTIRNLLRKVIESDHPEMKNIKRTHKPSKKKKTIKRGGNDRKHTSRTSEELVDFFLLTIARKKKRVHTLAVREQSTGNSANNDNDDTDESSSSDSDSDDSSLGISHPSTSNNNANEETSKVIVHREDVDDSPAMEIIEENNKGDEKEEEAASGSSGLKQKTNRDKFDSGLGDELLISELPLSMDVVEAISCSSSSDDEVDNYKRYKRCSKDVKIEKRANSKLRKIDRIEETKKCDSHETTSDTEGNTDTDSDYVEAMKRMKMYVSPFSTHMKNKIQELPLPYNVKKFLHFYREF